MGRFDKITSPFWFCLGLFITLEATRIGLGSVSDPGPGFIFFFGGILLSLLSVIVFVAAHRRNAKDEENSISWKGIRWGKLTVFIIALLIYTYFYEKIGFIVSSLVLMLYLFKGIEPQKWSTAIISAILTSIVTYAIFVLWLKCQLPRGILPF